MAPVTGKGSQKEIRALIIHRNSARPHDIPKTGLIVYQRSTHRLRWWNRSDGLSANLVAGLNKSIVG